MGAPLSEISHLLEGFLTPWWLPPCGFCLWENFYPFGSALLSEAFLFGTFVPLFPAPGPSLPDFRPSVPSPFSRLSSSELSFFCFLPQRFFPFGFLLFEGLAAFAAPFPDFRPSRAPTRAFALVGRSGLEPPTSRLSGECSNQLS